MHHHSKCALGLNSYQHISGALFPTLLSTDCSYYLHPYYPHVERTR